MKKRNQLLALCALVILVLTVFACENPFIPGKYKEPAPPQAPSISVAASPIGPYIKGEGLTITATAKVGDGGDLSYQWYSNSKNSNSGGKKISGATGESYRPSTDIEEAIDTAYYYVEATNTLYGRTTTASSRTVDVTVYDVGTDTPLREVNVTVITPVKGAEPSEVVATEAGYTLVEMEWDPWPRVFQERYQYTVTVKIQAENGYTLIALRSAKINGHAATINRIDGNTVELSYKFLEMKGVDAMEVKTQPSNMTYVHGNALDLSGLVVTVTYSDGTTEDVTAAEFADRDITTNPAHDSAVSHTNNDGRPIVVSHVGVTAETGNLTVSKAIITAPDVFVVGPLRGETPHTTTSVDSAENYTASAVSWSVGNTPFTGSTFEGSTQYTATVTLTVKSDDYVFASGGDLSAKISGLAATAVSNNTGTSITVSYQFAATSDKVITAIEIKTQPSTLTYTHGGTLNLNGLEVTVTYEGDPNPEDVPFAQFQSKNITTRPANGVTLTRAYPTNHNGTPVEVSIGAAFSVNTNQLVVNAKELAITGVSHSKPYDGNTTVTGGVTGVTFTGTIGDDNAHVSVTLSTVVAVYENADAGSTMRINGLTLEGNAAGNYTVTTPVTGVTATPGITKINPTMGTDLTTSWPDVASVTADAALSTAQFSFSGRYSNPTGLNGATVTGGYTFNSPGTTVALASSGNSYAATFTPNPATNYNSVTGTIVVTVRSTSTSTAAMEMVRIPAGSYAVSEGSPATYYTKNISAFYIGKYEVTQAQYNTVMGTNPSSFTSSPDTGEVQNRRPVENVTWYDAVEFCNKLSDLEGLTKVYTINSRTPSTGYPITSATVTMTIGNNGYRLPTETEWIYASECPIWLEKEVWYSNISNNKTHEVGKKLPNKNGLYDTLGNVQEWCWDWYATYASTSSQTTDPVGPSSGTQRTWRGGYYSMGISSGGVYYFSYRRGTGDIINYNVPSTKNNWTGFRVARR